MKKFLAGVTTAIMLSAGLVAVTASPAPAVDCGGQYQPVCVPAKPKAPKKVTTPAGKKPKVKITFATNSNVKPVGKVAVKLKGRKIPKKLRGKTLRFKVKKGKVVVKLPKLKPGKYKFKYKFNPKKGSAFKTMKGKVTIVVKKKKRR